MRAGGQEGVRKVQDIVITLRGGGADGRKAIAASRGGPGGAIRSQARRHHVVGRGGCTGQRIWK